MSEFWVRILVVVGAVIVATALSLVLRLRAGGPQRKLAGVQLDPGIYFFSSASCLECNPARLELVDRLGAAGFVEYSWETEPLLFSELGVDGVPATVHVDVDGSATFWPGRPGEMFSSVGP